jgi:hypothetical protein
MVLPLLGYDELGRRGCNSFDMEARFVTTGELSLGWQRREGDNNPTEGNPDSHPTLRAACIQSVDTNQPEAPWRAPRTMSATWSSGMTCLVPKLPGNIDAILSEMPWTKTFYRQQPPGKDEIRWNGVDKSYQHLSEFRNCRNRPSFTAPPVSGPWLPYMIRLLPRLQQRQIQQARKQTPGCDCKAIN